MGILLQPLFRLIDAHQPEHLQRPCLCYCARHLLMLPQRLHQLVPDGIERVQRGHGILKDHADAAAQQLAHLLAALLLQIHAVKQDGVGPDGGVIRQQLHHRHHADALAAAGFADNADKLACVHIKAHAAHRLNNPAAGGKVGAKVFHFQ